MAIDRREAMKRRETDIEPTVKELEHRLDTWLANPNNNGHFDCNEIPARVREEIERRYRAAGWKVTFISDQREGDFWSFE